MSAVTRRPFNSLELVLQAVVNGLVQVLGTKLWFSGRAAGTRNYWAISAVESQMSSTCCYEWFLRFLTFNWNWNLQYMYLCKPSHFSECSIVFILKPINQSIKERSSGIKWQVLAYYLFKLCNVRHYLNWILHFKLNLLWIQPVHMWDSWTKSIFCDRASIPPSALPTHLHWLSDWFVTELRTFAQDCVFSPTPPHYTGLGFLVLPKYYLYYLVFETLDHCKLIHWLAPQLLKSLALQLSSGNCLKGWKVLTNVTS